MLAIYPELAKHLKERSDVKSEGYGTPLKTNNGRHPLVDAYQELLDAILYMNQYTHDINIIDLRASTQYWVTNEPPPIDNDGDVVITDVMYDLKDVSFFMELDLADEDSLYRDTIQLAERIRRRIEHDKTKIQSEGGLSQTNIAAKSNSGSSFGRVQGILGGPE